MFQVIFDMDGVIFDSENTFLSCWLEVGARYGMEPELVRHTYMQCIGTNSNQTAEIYRSEIHRESQMIRHEHFCSFNYIVLPGTAQSLIERAYINKISRRVLDYPALNTQTLKEVTYPFNSIVV